eukprot:5587232-Pyramimonas_sp.AAC.1
MATGIENAVLLHAKQIVCTGLSLVKDMAMSHENVAAYLKLVKTLADSMPTNADVASWKAQFDKVA